MSEVKRCPACRAKMMSKPLEIETSESGVPRWRIWGTEVAVFVCSECGYIEFFDRSRMKAPTRAIRKKKQSAAAKLARYINTHNKK